MKPTVIIVTGLPGTGKTTLGKKLAEHFCFPFITRDAIKEHIFDTLSWSDREWSKKVGMASYAIMDYFIEQELKAGRSIIVESNFNPKFDNAKFQNWQSQYGFRAIQLLCFANGEALFERFKTRSESSERHPGHVDHTNYIEFKDSLLKGKTAPLAIEGKIITIDTTDFTTISIDKIIREIGLIE